MHVTLCTGFGQFQPPPGQSPLLAHTGLVSVGSQQFPHQAPMSQQQGAVISATQQHQVLLQQQRTALQEQMLKAQQEEQKRIEFERKQLRLKSIDVSKAASSTGPSLESLIGFAVSSTSSSPKLRPMTGKAAMLPVTNKAVPNQEDKLPDPEWSRKQDQLDTTHG